MPDSGEITYASHNKEGILRPTVTEGDIIVRSNPDAATDGTLGGLNRDLDRAREVTKDDKAYMDFYVSKQGIEELLDGFGGVVQGFEDLSENSKKILSGIDLAIAGYPEEVQAFGEAYKVAYKNMLLNGVSEEVALQVIANPEFQSHLATTTDLSKYSSMTDKIGSEGANVQYYIDPVTGQVKTRVSVTLENTVGRELYNELANFKLFIDSIPYENERTAILYGIQIALGGPIKTLISEVKDLFVNSFFKEAKDAIIENSYVFATTGLSKNEYLNTFVDVGPSLQAEFNQDIKDNARPVELGFAIVGIAGSIKSLQKGKGVKTDRYQGTKPGYHINEAHVAGPKYTPNKTPLPKDAEVVYKNAVPDNPVKPKYWYGVNENGDIYRFSPSNTGEIHFSGRSDSHGGLNHISVYALKRLGKK